MAIPVSATFLMAALLLDQPAAAPLSGYIPLSAHMASKRQSGQLPNRMSTNPSKKTKMSLQTPASSSPPQQVKDLSDTSSSSTKKKTVRKKATQDGEAVERRRTQLRLAQRAYRERKESTIADLEKKTANLEQALGDMYSIFSEYHESASLQQASTADAKWVTDLDHVRTQLVHAMHQAGVDPDGEKVNERRRIRASASPVPPSGVFEAEQVRRQRALSTGYALEPSDTLGYGFGQSPARANTLFPTGSMQMPVTMTESVSSYSLNPRIRVSGFLSQHAMYGEVRWHLD